MQQSADKGQTPMVQTLHLRGHVWRGSVGHDEGGQRQDVSKESSAASPASPRPLFDVLYGDTLPPGVPIDAAKPC
jgi:hypothetical protein